MADVVGCSCVLCGERIASIFDGVFCPDCRGPYHHKCFGNPARERTAGRCNYCGGDLADRQAVAARKAGQQGFAPGSASVAPSPAYAECPFCRAPNPTADRCDKCGYDFKQTVRVAATCPSCGGTSYRRIRPNRFIAFTHDRICKDCKTRYVPPTPVWAAFVFILAGLPLAGIFGWFALARMVEGNPAGLPAMAVEGLLALLGLLAIGQGLRALLNPGKV
jgi:hypothetical protein